MGERTAMKWIDRFIVMALVGLLTWLLINGLSPGDERLNGRLAAIDSYMASQSALHRDVLSARAGLLANYDPLDRHLERMRATAAIATGGVIDVEERRHRDEILATLGEQEALVERFKSTNALLHNSLAYFVAFGGRIATEVPDPRVRQRFDQLSSAMLNLSLNGSETAAREVAERLSALEAACDQTGQCGRDAQRLLAHGRLLRRILPNIETTIERMIRADPVRPAMALRQHMLAERQASEASASWFRYLLYLASLLLLILLFRWMLKVRHQSALMRRQLALEKAVSTLSTRLLVAGGDGIEAAVRDGLRELGRVIGAGRAHFWVGREQRSYTWPTGGEPARRDCIDVLSDFSSPADLEGHEVVHLVRADLAPDGTAYKALESAGLESCLSVMPPGKGLGRNLLIFGFEKRHEEWPASQLGVLSTVLDSVSLALARRDAEEEREAFEARLSQARRMETIGAFASGIAHNFNNLLGAIAGHAEMAEGSPRLTQRLRTHLAQIRLSSDRGQQIVQSLLGYGRRRERQLRPVTVDLLLAESRGLAEAALPPGYRVEFEADAPDATVEVDAAQFQQVILNLCRNAAHAMPEGGLIRLTSEHRTTAAPIRHAGGILPAGDHVLVKVLDHGRGIDPAVMDRIFEPFFTTRDQGTGLGLSTARDIMTEFGGGLMLDSVTGGGTTATLWLPLASGAAPVADDARSQPNVLGNGETIIYLARDEADRLAGEELLAALGYEPVGFTHPAALLAAVRTRPDHFDGLLAADDRDIAIVEAVRGLLPRTPRILATVHAGSHCAERLLQAGVTALVKYPLDTRELADTLHAALRRARQQAATIDG